MTRRVPDNCQQRVKLDCLFSLCAYIVRMDPNSQILINFSLIIISYLIIFAKIAKCRELFSLTLLVHERSLLSDTLYTHNILQSMNYSMHVLICLFRTLTIRLEH